MAKKQLAGTRVRTVETVEETPREAVEDRAEEMDQETVEVLEGEDRIDDEIEELVGGEDREGLVKIFRWNVDAKRWRMLPSMARQGFTRDLVAESWGGGRYLMKVYKGKAYKGSKTFEVDEAVRPRARPAAASGDGPGGDAPSWLSATLDKMSEAIKVIAARPNPTPPDPIKMIESLALTMKALTPTPSPVVPPPDFETQLNIIEKVVGVGTKILAARGDGEGDSGDAYMGVVSKLAEPIIRLVEQQAQREAQGRRPNLTPSTGPVPAQRPAGVPPTQPAVTAGPAWAQELQRWIPLIYKRQQKGLGAESTAFFVLDELSEPTLAAVADLAARDDFAEILAQALPVEMRNAPTWTSEFAVAVRDYLLQEDVGGEVVGEIEPDVEPVAEPAVTVDIAKEADRRLAALRDKPDDGVQEPTPGPVTP